MTQTQSVYLLPAKGTRKAALRALYERAILEAKELFVLTAYLREWNVSVRLPESCKRFLLIAGTDFGISRKQAMRAVLRWLPAHRHHEFLATSIGGFHPKAMLWKTTKGHRWLLVGSSNLTSAGLGSNHEANVLVRPSEAEYEEVRDWIGGIESDPDTVEVDSHFIDQYREGKALPKPKKSPGTGATATVPMPRAGAAAGLARRRAQQRRFVADRGRWLSLMDWCVRGGRKNDQKFYERMRALWKPSRFQGRGIEILGKNSNWHITCAALLRIVRAVPMSVDDMDDLVAKEIDRLARIGIAMRKAWFSEMLCHFFPDTYPALDAPVTEWLGSLGFRASRGSSEGYRYVQIARLMRATVARSEVRDLPELDYRIWAWSDARATRVRS